MSTAILGPGWTFESLARSLSQECTVCLQTKEVSDFPSTPLTNACLHDASTCLDCLESCIRSDLDSKRWSDVACPECDGHLTSDAVQEYADDESWQRYTELSLRSSLEKDKHFVWCATGCGNGQIHEGGLDQPIVKCSSCGGRTCFQHKVPWHAGLTCDDWDLIKGDDGEGSDDVDPRMRAYRITKASEDTIKEISKPCPGCGRSIEKNGGCSHMTCSLCTHEFCWLCGGPWGRHKICVGGYFC